MIQENILRRLYQKQRKSQQEIARKFDISLSGVAYWMNKYRIQRRSISDAVYVKCNPKGDPFKFIPPNTKKDSMLFGLGIGLYWGEGTKACTGSVRLGNTDPKLIRTFMSFLIRLFGVEKKDFKFSLQLFRDIDTNTAARFWQRQLRVRPGQFTKATISPSQSRGTYRKKCPHGVVTLYYHNKKLRDVLVRMVQQYEPAH